jgi:hypothetical protein
MIANARLENSVSDSRRNAAKPEAGREWSKLDEAIYKAHETVIASYKEVHAIYETRERKRNAQLGLFPTLAELVSIVRDEQPNQQTLDATPPNFTQAEIEVKTLNR